jgi:type VI secretion system secreted protein Hcp
MATDIHLKLGDIKGESTDDKHKDEIDVLSWSWGMSNPTSIVSRAGRASKVKFQDIQFVHRIDKATSSIMKACATGGHIKDATLTQRKAGKDQLDYIVIKLNDVIVTSVSDSAVSGGDQPMENVTLAFAKVDFEYKPQKPDGSLDPGIHFKYDIKANKEG